MWDYQNWARISSVRMSGHGYLFMKNHISSPPPTYKMIHPIITEACVIPKCSFHLPHWCSMADCDFQLFDSFVEIIASGNVDISYWMTYPKMTSLDVINKGNFNFLYKSILILKVMINCWTIYSYCVISPLVWCYIVSKYIEASS